MQSPSGKEPQSHNLKISSTTAFEVVERAADTRKINRAEQTTDVP